MERLRGQSWEKPGGRKESGRTVDPAAAAEVVVGWDSPTVRPATDVAIQGPRGRTPTFLGDISILVAKKRGWWVEGEFRGR